MVYSGVENDENQFQPAGIHALGRIFARLWLSDAMVLLDNTWLAQGFTFVNRNRIKGPDGELWITVPVTRRHGRRQMIRDLVIFEKRYWGKKWLATLHHAYGQSVYYRQIIDSLAIILEMEGAGFMDLMIPVLEFMKGMLGIKTPLMFQSDLGIKSRGDRLLVDIAAEVRATEVVLPYFARGSVDWTRFEKQGVKVRFLHYASPVYPQFWGGYLRNLSVLDLLFCLGKAGREVLERGSKIS